MYMQIFYPSFEKFEPGEQYAIDLNHIFAGYGKKTILHNVTLKVRSGDIIAMVGNSGAGKSTAIRCMTAQITPLEGTAHTAGISTKNQETVQALIGYVPQLEYLSLYYNFSALDNALFFGWNYGLSSHYIKRRCKELMKILGLEEKEFLRKPVKQLSGGEKKRVSIMIGLINDPEILFLDEPTTGLDPHLRIEVLNFLQVLNQKFHTTMVLVSHDLECVDYCNRVVCFADGALVDYGSPRKMVSSLPNNGKAYEVHFKQLSLEQENKLLEISQITYFLHIGRNKYKLFFESPEDLQKIKIVIQSLHMEIIYEILLNSTFLEYFRIKK